MDWGLAPGAAFFAAAAAHRCRGILRNNQLFVFSVRTSNHHKQHSKNYSEGAKGLLFEEIARSFFLSIVEQYIVEETLQIINFLLLVSELQAIINSTQRTIQKALRVYFLRTLCVLSF